MGAKPLSVVKLSDTLSLSEYRPGTYGYHGGFWVWDSTRQMNLATGKDTAQDALLEVVRYYQKRLAFVEGNYKAMRAKVCAFVDSDPLTEDLTL